MQLTNHIHALKLPFQITIGQDKKLDRFVYVYLIFGKKICLIDSGVAGSEQIIFNYIKKEGRRPEDISLLILTHSHPDHIGAAKTIKELINCPIAAHLAEKAWIEDIELQFKERPVPGFNLLVKGSVNVDRVIKDQDILNLDNGLKLEVFRTPGHSKGSCSFWFKADRALFCADTILLPKDLPIYEDVLQLVKSIIKLKAIKGINILLSSWDEPRKGDQLYQVMESSLNYLQHIHEMVIKVADKNVSMEPMELCKRVLKELGMPAEAANPLIVRSFQANLAARQVFIYRLFDLT